MYSDKGSAFVVLPATAAGGTVSRIRAPLTPGSMVTTIKNTVDNVVTEHGVAKLRDKSISERAKALIAIAQPQFRAELTAQAREHGYPSDLRHGTLGPPVYAGRPVAGAGTTRRQ